jgi:serine-type D-Ala-D-Ala carboxypeptidase (penicillin-binding protein 5/6)
MACTAPARTAPRRARSANLAALLAVTAVAILAVCRLVDGTPRSAAAPPADSALGTIGWPAAGVSAAEVTGGRLLLGPGAERPVPIASVAKVMTAYVVLHDHPLGADESGPRIVVEPSEAAAYPAEADAGESVVPVEAGEVLSERQALEALLLPSADNVAWILARWDAGSLGEFVNRMNAVARQLGMTSTHYTDPSGLAASTTSSPADQVRLAIAAMGQPALAEVASQSSAVIPVAGTVDNLNRLLGEDGIVGLKTGSTSAAGGCVLLAARSEARHPRSLIVVAVFGQPGSPDTILPAALHAGQQLLIEIERHVEADGTPMNFRTRRSPSRS